MSDQSSESISSLIPAPADRIADFCRTVIERHSEHWPITEPVLADEFLAFFGLNSFLIFEGMVEFCQSRLRIPVSLTPLPGEFRGFNDSYGTSRKILIAAKQDFPGAKLHTLLHELREVIEHGFQKLGCASAQGDELEDRAEAFASSVQISAAINKIPEFLDTASEIEKKWKRLGAYVLVFAGAILYCFACASLPRIEDALAAERSDK
jgi:hypothetical protein